MVNKTAFIYLTAFSRTGGIEQFNKNVLASFKDGGLDAYTVYDDSVDERYFNHQSFKGFNGNKLACLWAMIKQSRQYQTILIGHINLAPFIFLLRLFHPRLKLVLFAHGIEVWKPLTGKKAWLLKEAQSIFAVSNFTKSSLVQYNAFIQSDTIQILPNALDPFFAYPTHFSKPGYLLDRYGIQPSEKVLLTVARLSSEEQYKGYDQVIHALQELWQSHPTLKYIIAGKADELELARVTTLIENAGLTQHVVLAGFINEDELIDHYLLADTFVLPSKGEGFGIVLIEALACGRKVISGNKDGSVDALKNGELGTLVDPSDLDQLKLAIINSLKDTSFNSKAIQESAQNNFGFHLFKSTILDYLSK